MTGTTGPFSRRGGPILLLLLACLAAQAKDEAPKKTATPSTPPVALVEAGSPGAGISLADVGRPDVVVPLNWVEKNGKAVQLELGVTPLISGRGAGVQPTISDPASSSSGPFNLQPGQVLTVVLQAYLPSPGTYRAFVRATVIEGTVKTRLDPVPITITRSLAAPSVEFLEASALAVDAGWFAQTLNAKMSLEAFTSTPGMTLATPQVQATRKNTVDASAGTITAVTLVTPDGKAPPSPLVPGKITTLPLDLGDIPGPGRYDVALRYLTEGYKPLETKRVLFVREPALMALSFVLLGVAMSFAIQFWGTVIRPVRELQRRVHALAEAVRAAGAQAGAAANHAEVVTLLDGVGNSLQARNKEGWLDRARSVGSLDVFETIVPAVPTWIALWHQLEQVRPNSVRERHQDALLVIRQNFIAATPDVTLVQEGVKALDHMPLKIRADVAAALEGEISKLSDSLAASPSTTMVAFRARLRRAAAKLKEGQVEAAITIYQQVGRDFVAEMANTLNARIDAGLATPPGLDPKEWQALRDDTLRDLAGLDAETEVDRALAQLKRATKTYVQGFAAGLLRAVDKKSPNIRDPVNTAVQSVEALIKADDMVGAWDALDKVQQAYAQAQQTAGQAMGQHDADALRAATRPPDGRYDANIGFDLPGWWARLGAPGTAARIDRHTLLGDLGISFLSLILAGLGVWQALWVPNPVWGGLGAWLAAILAGFAIDRVTQAAATALRR